MAYINTKKLLLVSQFFFPEMISTGHVLTELLLELTKKGFEPVVIAAQPTYYSREKIETLIKYRGVKIRRTQNSQFDKNSIRGKIFNSLSFFIHASLLALQQTRGPILLVTNPPFLGILGPILKLLTRQPFILIIHDLYPDIAVNIGYLNHKSLVTRAWRLLNQRIFREAFSIVVLGRDVQQHIRKQLPPKLHPKVVYIPNWADPSLIYPIERTRSPLLKELNLEGKFIVEYSGNVGLTHDMETIIEAARELRGDTEVHFLIIGGGGKLQRLKVMVDAYRLPNLTFLPYQPRERLKDTLGIAHVSLISLANGCQGLSVPSKLYGILASGRPSIAIVPEETEVAMTLRQFACGIVIPPGDFHSLVKAINGSVKNFV